MGMISEYAAMTIKSVILSNSTAAGAVLVLLGTGWGRLEARGILGPAVESIQVFAAGTFMAMCAAGISYLSQFSYARGDMATDICGAKCLARTGLILQVVAVLATTLGLLSFALAASPTNKPSPMRSPPGNVTATATMPRQTGTSLLMPPASSSSTFTLSFR
jgi:hypothetical protein